MATFKGANNAAIAVLIVFRSTTSQAQAGPETLTLDEAVRLALDHNRAVEQALLAEQEADNRIATAKTRRLPSFKFSTTGGILITQPTVTFEQGAFGSYPGIGPVPGSVTEITSPRQPAAIITGSVALPLTQQHRIGLEILQLNLSRKIAHEQVRLTRQQVVHQVREAYYAILQGQSSLEAVEQSLALYRDLDVTTDRYVKVGTKLAADLLNVRARLRQAEYEKEALEGPLATQKERLNQLLGRPIETEFRVASAVEASWIAPELPEARAKALAARPEIEQARLKVQQAATDRRIKKSEYIPDVSLTTAYYSMVNLASTLPTNIAIAGVQVSWEPFDWGRKRHELSAKEKVAQQAALGLAETQDQVRIEVGNAHRKMEQARLMMAAARAGQENAAEAARLTSVRFRFDAALLNSVLEAQSGLAAANERVQKALVAYWSARADLEKAMGEEQ